MLIKGNPLSIKHEDRIRGAHPVQCETHHPPVSLTATNEAGIELFTFVVGPDEFHTLESTYGDVTLTYRDRHGTTIKTEAVDSASRFGLDVRTIGERKAEMQERTLLERLTDTVKDQMDNPEGSPEDMERHTDLLNKTTMDVQARHYVENKIRGILISENMLGDHQIDAFTKQIYANLYGMGILQEIDDDPEVGEIMVNGFIYPAFRSEIYYIKHGEKILYPKTFKSLDDLINVYSRSIAFSKKELNSVENAMVEATRSNGDRVNIIIPDASESYLMNIRKFGNFTPDKDTMKKSGTVDEHIDRLLDVFVHGKANIGIGGEMGTGKTTTINYLLTKTEEIERKVVVASVNEISTSGVLKGHDIAILNVDEEKGFTFERLIRSSLRTTASRIIVPESRGDEFKQVHEANLKTKGNIFTAHALDDYSFLEMCVDMYMGDTDGNPDLIRNKLASAMNIIIIMRKVGKDIRIKSISEIILDERRRYSHINRLYEWVQDKDDPTKGHYARTEHKISDYLKALMNEYIPMKEMEGL